jgi:hypothetical protein
MALMDGESVWGSLDEKTVEFLHDTFYKMAKAVLGKELFDCNQ